MKTDPWLLISGRQYQPPTEKDGGQIQMQLFDLYYKSQLRESLQVLFHEKTGNPDGLSYPPEVTFLFLGCN